LTLLTPLLYGHTTNLNHVFSRYRSSTRVLDTIIGQSTPTEENLRFSRSPNWSTHVTARLASRHERRHRHDAERRLFVHNHQRMAAKPSSSSSRSIRRCKARRWAWAAEYTVGLVYTQHTIHYTSRYVHPYSAATGPQGPHRRLILANRQTAVLIRNAELRVSVVFFPSSGRRAIDRAGVTGALAPGSSCCRPARSSASAARVVISAPYCVPRTRSWGRPGWGGRGGWRADFDGKPVSLTRRRGRSRLSRRLWTCSCTRLRRIVPGPRVRLSNHIRIRFEEVSDRSEDGGPGGRVSRRQLSNGDGEVEIHASGSGKQEDHLAWPKVGTVHIFHNMGAL